MRLKTRILLGSTMCLATMVLATSVSFAAPAKASAKAAPKSATPVAVSETASVAAPEVAQSSFSIAGKVALVDVTKIVAESKQVKALKEEQLKKSKELENWLKTARENVEKQKTDAAKEKMVKKYEEDLAQKRSENAKLYAQKLNEIDKSISDSIAAYAKANGYDIVLSKSTVLYGGNDITAEIAKIVK